MQFTIVAEVAKIPQLATEGTVSQVTTTTGTQAVCEGLQTVVFNNCGVSEARGIR